MEIKSKLTKESLIATEKSAQYLFNKIYSSNFSKYNDYNLFKPISSILGFYGSGARELKYKTKGKKWLKENIKNLKYICLISKYSWIKMRDTNWTCGKADKFNCRGP